MDTSDGGATSQDVQSVKLVNDDHATGAAGASNTTPVEKWSNGDATSIDLSVSVNEEDIDPFTYRPPFTKWDYLKITINALWLFPLRLIFVVIPSMIVGIFTCLLAIACDRYDEDDPHPLNRWGRFVMGRLGPLVTRVFLFGFGFNWIHTRGRLASTKEAPILVVSPHSCLLDIFVISLYSRYPTFLARSDVKHIPLFGMLINKTMRTIFVKREDPESRTKAAEEIRRRTHTRGDWPKVLLFPEGTTTNTKALISFKQGAFLPKLPVQPALIKYKNKLNTTTWGEDGLGVMCSLFLTLCQFHNKLEVEFLPVYQPSEEEMDNTKLFARNVQVHMARALGVPHTNHAFEDVLLMRTARKAGLPFRSGMVVYLKANQDLKIDLKTMKKWLRRFVVIDNDRDGYVTAEDFARFLQVPDDAPLQSVFRGAEPGGDGKLSYRRYLYGIVGKAQPLLQDASKMQSMFSFFDSDSDGIVSEADISNRLPFKCFAHTEEHVVSGQQEGGGSESHDADEAAGHVASSQQEGGGSETHDQSHDADEAADIKGMSLDQFTSRLASHPEYVLIFNEYVQATGTTTSPPLVVNSVNHLQTQSADTSDVGNGWSLTNDHMTKQQGGGCHGEDISERQLLLPV